MCLSHCRNVLRELCGIQLTTSEKHQKSLLGGVERLVGETYPQLIKSDVPKILMAFYQADILEEDVVTQWATHVSKKVKIIPSSSVRICSFLINLSVFFSTLPRKLVKRFEKQPILS